MALDYKLPQKDMKLFFDNIDRIIALILVLGTLGLLATGIDGEVKSILTLSAGWAFGSTYQKRRANQNPK